jgi:hypothetical protein
MIKKYTTTIINRFGVRCTIQIALMSLSGVLLTAAVFQLFVPVHLVQTDSQINTLSGSVTSESISLLLDENKNKDREAVAYRPGMFKPATGIQDKPIADKTIERIKDQLKLQCVMELNGQTVAYINIQGVGLKKCCVGESVNDLFTVTKINKESKSVEISIVNHQVTLHL